MGGPRLAAWARGVGVAPAWVRGGWAAPSRRQPGRHAEPAAADAALPRRAAPRRLMERPQLVHIGHHGEAQATALPPAALAACAAACCLLRCRAWQHSPISSPPIVMHVALWPSPPSLLTPCPSNAVIPNALAQEMKVYAYQHDGYWHVSGTRGALCGMSYGRALCVRRRRLAAAAAAAACLRRAACLCHPSHPAPPTACPRPCAGRVEPQGLFRDQPGPGRPRQADAHGALCLLCALRVRCRLRRRFK